MGIRESLNRNPAITTGLTAGIIVLALVFVVWQLRGPSGPKPVTKAFYTTDDGATWFVDERNKPVPFTHEGKEAVRVYVYQCEPDGKKFAGFLEKMTPKAREMAEAAYQEGRTAMIEDGDLLVKKPGPGRWVSVANIDAAEKVFHVECPGGGIAKLVNP